VLCVSVELSLNTEHAMMVRCCMLLALKVSSVSHLVYACSQARYDMDHALVLSKTHKFGKGMLLEQAVSARSDGTAEARDVEGYMLTASRVLACAVLRVWFDTQVSSSCMRDCACITRSSSITWTKEPTRRSRERAANMGRGSDLLVCD